MDVNALDATDATDPQSGSIVASALAFGAVEVGRIAAGSITLTNPGVSPVAISTISISGSAISKGPTTCGAALDGGASCTQTVSIAPFHLGPFGGELTVAWGVNTTVVPITAAAAARLVVERSFLGTGTVMSNGAIDCGTTCDALVQQPVTLMAVPTGTSRFAGWIGAPSCGVVPACALEPSIQPTTVRAIFLAPGDSAVQLAFGGNAPTEVAPTTGTEFAACIGPCVVGVAAGASITIQASSPSTYVGMSGACNTSANSCTFTPTGDTTVTVTSTRAPNETVSRFVPGLITFGIDAAGNTVIGSAFEPRQVIELDPGGAVLWAVPVGGTHVVAVQPDGHVAVWAGTTLRRLAPDGSTEWLVDVGESVPVDLDYFTHQLAIAPSGDIVVKLASATRVYTNAGALRWERADLTSERGSVAIAASGVVTAASCCDPIANWTIQRTLPDGTPLPSIATLASAFGLVDHALDSAGAPTTSRLHDEFRSIERRRLDGSLVFGDGGVDANTDPRGSTVAVATDDTVWWSYHLAHEEVDYTLVHYSADGALLGSISRGNVTGFVRTLGPYIYDMHAGGAGSVIVGGVHNGFGTYGFIQQFGP